MKKNLLGILLLLISIFLIPNTTSVRAETIDKSAVEINTLYPSGVLDYHNLTGVNQVTSNENYIAYAINDNKINIFNKTNRVSTYIDGFNNITEIKYVSHDQLLVVDYNGTSGNIKSITLDDTNPTITTINIDLSNLKLIDIYESGNTVLIGLIRNETENNKFELYELDNATSLSTTATLHHTNQSSTYYNSASILVLSDTKQYVVYDSNSRILVNSLNNTEIDGTPMNILNNVQKLKYYKNGSLEYLLAFTEENMCILSSDYSTPTESFTNIDLKVNKFTDIDISLGEILICDADNSTTNKSIKSYKLTKQDDKITIADTKLLLSSSDSSLGRFNSVSDIYKQGDTFYVSDTKNNRIQIIDNLECYEISNLETDCYPHSVVLDSNQNVYFVTDNVPANTSTLLKYHKEDNNYTLVNTFATINDSSIGRISDCTIDNNNVLYFIDYPNNRLLYLNSAGVQIKGGFTNFTVNAQSKIDYLRANNLLVIYNNNHLYLISPEDLSIINQIELNNCVDISVGFNSIFALSDNQIKYIEVNAGNTMQISENSLDSDSFSQFNCITFDIVDNTIYAFNTSTQSINYLSCDLTSNPFNFDNISSSTPLTSASALKAIDIKNNGLIYDQPYKLGNYYSVTSCIGIDEYGDYYRVLFNDNNTLKVGFLNKNLASVQEYETARKIRVLTTNLQVPVYKYPTILKHNNQAIITSYIPINTLINITYNSFPISIDGKQFYLYENNGQIGYIFNADVVLDENKHITYLHTENASIMSIDTDSVNIYAEDYTTVITTIASTDRVYVDNYDKNSEYTKVIYKDADLNTIEGYIKTDYIQMDKLDNNRIALILIIVLSVIILVVIITSYIIIKKRK